MPTGTAVALEALVVLVLSAIGVWVLQRQLDREERERAARRRAASPALRQLAELYGDFLARTGAALMPIARAALRAAADIERTYAKLWAAINGIGMSDEQEQATTAELVRLTLGGRPDRPELIVHPTDRDGVRADWIAIDEAARWSGPRAGRK